MKFSYRIILLLTLSLTLAAILIIWVSFHNQNLRKNHIQELEFAGVLSARKPSARKPPSKATPSDRNAEEHVGNWTRNRDEVVPRKFYESRTDLKTYDILKEINSKVKATFPLQGETTSTVEEEDGYHPKKLKVIVVPHSHNDPGWHKTVDGYFEDQTRNILNNMVEKLQKYPKMTFIWAESVFLSLWWKELDKDARQSVLRLISRRQLEIVGGGWIVTDEANCHYFAIIDQMIEGHRWLHDNVGVTPKNSWSLDPFGYSSFHPYFYRKVEFQNAVVLRVSDDVKNVLQERKALEFYWRQIWDKGNKTDFFTLMMPYMLYNIKHSCGPDKDVCLMFDFRQISGEASESRAIPIHSGNVDRQAKLLLGQYQKKADLYRHGVVLVPLGDDFRYDRNIEWDQQFKNYMTMFNHINAQKNWNVEIRFGTVQDYFDEVTKVVAESGKLHKDFFPTLSGDFFPYTDHSNEYWTGYFTSRPFSKVLGRELEVYLRAADILTTICLAQSLEETERYNAVEDLAQLDVARKHLALFQHHDAIAGTATTWVVQDSENRLYQGLHLMRSVVNNMLSFLLSNSVQPKSPVSVRVLDPLYARTLSAVQVVRLSDDRVKVVIFNPVTRQRQELIQIEVDRKELEVINSEGHVIRSQIGPAWSKSQEQESEYSYLLSFLTDLPALGVITYDVVKTVTPKNTHVSEVRKFTDFTRSSEFIVIENSMLQANVSVSRGRLSSIVFKQDGSKLDGWLSFLFYSSRRSGAYLFAPSGPASAMNFTRPKIIFAVTGPVFSEVRIKSSCVTHVLRLANCFGPLGTVLEVNNIVDMASPDYDELELIMRFDTSVRSRNVFYTDQNGYHVMKRRRYQRFLEANYYPASSVVYIEDEKLRVSMITAQPVGVSSLKQGSVEVMLDRRLRYDDNRGLGAGVQDNRIVLSRFYILVEPISKAADTDANLVSLPTMLANVLIDSLRNYPIVATSNYRGKLPTITLMNAPLPCDTLLVTLKTFVNASKVAAMVLHRQGYSANYELYAGPGCYQKREDVVLSGLFPKMQVKKAFESSLSFMYRKQELHRDHPLHLDPLELYAYEILYI